jgi:hypothetical protein
MESAALGASATENGAQGIDALLETKRGAGADILLYRYAGTEGEYEGTLQLPYLFRFSLDLPPPPEYTDRPRVYLSPLVVPARPPSLGDVKGALGGSTALAQFSAAAPQPPGVGGALAPASEAQLPPGEDGRASRPIARYQRGDLLGKGGFGRVYRAINLEDASVFAMKEIELGAASESQQTQMAALQREVALMQRLKHPNIVRYLGMEVSPSKIRIFMELVGGRLALLGFLAQRVLTAARGGRAGARLIGFPHQAFRRLASRECYPRIHRADLARIALPVSMQGVFFLGAFARPCSLARAGTRMTLCTAM